MTTAVPKTNSPNVTTIEENQFDTLWQGTRDLVHASPTNVSFELTLVVSVPTKPTDAKDIDTCKPDLRKFAIKYPSTAGALPSGMRQKDATFSVVATKMNQFQEIFFEAKRATWSQYPHPWSLFAACFPGFDTANLRLSVASFELFLTEKMDVVVSGTNPAFSDWINKNNVPRDNWAVAAKYDYKNDDTSPHTLSHELESKDAEDAPAVDFSYAQFN